MTHYLFGPRPVTFAHTPSLDVRGRDDKESEGGSQLLIKT